MALNPCSLDLEAQTLPLELKGKGKSLVIGRLKKAVMLNFGTGLHSANVAGSHRDQSSELKLLNNSLRLARNS